MPPAPLPLDSRPRGLPQPQVSPDDFSVILYTRLDTSKPCNVVGLMQCVTNPKNGMLGLISTIAPGIHWLGRRAALSGQGQTSTEQAIQHGRQLQLMRLKSGLHDQAIEIESKPVRNI